MLLTPAVLSNSFKRAISSSLSANCISNSLMCSDSLTSMVMHFNSSAALGRSLGLRQTSWLIIRANCGCTCFGRCPFRNSVMFWTRSMSVRNVSTNSKRTIPREYMSLWKWNYSSLFVSKNLGTDQLYYSTLKVVLYCWRAFKKRL